MSPIIESAKYLSVGHIQRALERFDWTRLGIKPASWFVIAAMMNPEGPMAEA